MGYARIYFSLLNYIVGADASAKFTSLRDTFVKELKKTNMTPRSGAGEEDDITDTISKWEFYSEMLFIKEFVAGRQYVVA